jgi:hypothetical protein
MIDTMRPWLISLSICLLAGFGWYVILENGNARIEANCEASGGQAIQRPGQASYCLNPP